MMLVEKDNRPAEGGKYRCRESEIERHKIDGTLPQEKLCALRQCVERVLIDKPGGSVVVKIKAVPASTIQIVEELARELGPADAVVPGNTESSR